MFKFILCLFLLVPFSSGASDWTSSDTKREAIYLTLHTVDWAQTRNISRSAECKNGSPPPCWYEQNAILGRCPSIARVNQYFAATAALQFAVAYYLPPEYRKAFQYITLGIEFGAVTHNISLGIKATF